MILAWRRAGKAGTARFNLEDNLIGCPLFLTTRLTSVRLLRRTGFLFCGINLVKNLWRRQASRSSKFSFAVVGCLAA
jgi:hypothetical protein